MTNLIFFGDWFDHRHTIPTEMSLLKRTLLNYIPGDPYTRLHNLPFISSSSQKRRIWRSLDITENPNCERVYFIIPDSPTLV